MTISNKENNLVNAVFPHDLQQLVKDMDTNLVRAQQLINHNLLQSQRLVEASHSKITNTTGNENTLKTNKTEPKSQHLAPKSLAPKHQVPQQPHEMNHASTVDSSTVQLNEDLLRMNQIAERHMLQSNAKIQQSIVSANKSMLAQQREIEQQMPCGQSS